jgi:histidyl-tRNA synthetase
MTGPVFRREQGPAPGHYREFTQAGVELLGAGGAEADAEVIALALHALQGVGLPGATVRIGHVGLILELFRSAGLPTSAFDALVENLSAAASEGETIGALESALARLAGWLSTPEENSLAPSSQNDAAVDRLFRTLVPSIVGRRSSDEIVERLHRKWSLAHSLHDVLNLVRQQVHALADLHGPAYEVLGRLDSQFAASAPEAVASLRELVAALDDRGILPDRITLDLGFGRGIGFYSRMIFELMVQTTAGSLTVGGGGRYDGLAQVLGSDRDARGVGFALGLERLALALETRSEVAGPNGGG